MRNMRSMQRLAVLTFFLLSVSGVLGQLNYTLNGNEKSAYASQCWYEGYWTKWGPITAPFYSYPTPNVTGNIIVIENPESPADSLLRKLSLERPAAVILYSRQSGEAGVAMYSVDGKDRHSITVPVVEIFEVGTKENTLLGVPQGTVVTVTAQENGWKKAADSKFQFVVQLLLSAFELVVLGFAGYRWYQFWKVSEISSTFHKMVAIGPLCMGFQIIASGLRLSYLIVDPFYTYRLIHSAVANILFTAHFPFLLCAGICLTFFWAESLSQRSVKATPFISRFKIPAIVVVLLIVCETVSSFARAFLEGSQLYASYITVTFYLIVDLILVVCYIHCARQILQRIGSKNTRIRRMTIHFILSATGYIAIIILQIMIVVVWYSAWPSRIVYNIIFLVCAYVSLMQILGMKPMKSKTSQSSESNSRGKKNDLPEKKNGLSSNENGLQTKEEATELGNIERGDAV